MDDLEALRARVVEHVHVCFRDVTRTGGMSWRDSEVADFYGDETYATHKDTDSSWQELVDDENWDPTEIGVGGFSFLDPVGFRYYLPPAMLRAVKVGRAEALQFQLALHSTLNPLRAYQSSQFSLLTPEQNKCVRLFLEYMRALALHSDDHREAACWGRLLKRYWNRF